MIVPSRTAQPDVQLDRVERLLRVQLLNVFRLDKRQQRLYLQRSILVTSKPDESVAAEMERLVQDISDDEHAYDFEITGLHYRDGGKRPQVPYDSSVISITSPLVVVRRSPKTGQIFHDPEMQWCPHTAVALRPFITSHP